MREKIIQAALKLFSEKGYHLTNVQEIANCTGIARGTLYTHFSSKKSILVAIYEHYLDCLYKSLDKEPPHVKGTFDQRIDYLHGVLKSYLSVALEHEDFLIMQMKEQNINDESVIGFIQDKRNKIYRRFQELMKYVGGKELNHCVLDMAIILNSLIEEYSAVVILDGADISIDDLVGFISDTVVCVFNGFKSKEIEPILSENYLQRVEANNKNIYIGEIYEKLCSINKIIQSVYLSPDSIREVESSLILINSEMKKKNPDIIIVKGMLRNIAQVNEVKFIAENLLEVFEKLENNKR
ncbi:TetR/AcrR family transcriptional regulator [Neobacillus sp. YIM B02564]|jgi:AcrR family transcriptional regulator|uniref:TetR/AcrR family transcriptional regulator n=1 Tax=Neobacillus paridis TaxID=2803862 RepID=A0ABS1TWU5_9BACI|nr:TetR/AcrR family transcriptional regulator [Neobacillus paridis]MBL4955033.1 TetR/AcrR family transcriptional regulator [Neobacillus paridis]